MIMNMDLSQTNKPTVTFHDNDVTIHESNDTNTNTTESLLCQCWFYSQKWKNPCKCYKIKNVCKMIL